MTSYISPRWNFFVSRPTPLLKREFLKDSYLYLNDYCELEINSLFVIASEKENHVFVNKKDDIKCEKLAEQHYLKKQSEKILRKFARNFKKWKFPGPILEATLSAFRTIGASLIYTYYLERALNKYHLTARWTEKARLGKLIVLNSSLRDQGARIMYGLYDQFRAKFKSKDIDYYSLEEVIKKKKVSKKLIDDRKKFFVAILKKGQTQIFTGRQAQKVLQQQGFKIIEIDLSANEVKGLPVYKGKIKGEVVKIKNLADFQSKNCVDKIIVATDTIIEYTPYLKKAAAIVTDCGGITSHAAITAREYKLPAIVGTKYATQMFKDGDVVEVDAERGVVRKL